VSVAKDPSSEIYVKRIVLIVERISPKMSSLPKRALLDIDFALLMRIPLQHRTVLATPHLQPSDPASLFLNDFKVASYMPNCQMVGLSEPMLGPRKN
jgi:hypothetical protein